MKVSLEWLNTDFFPSQALDPNTIAEALTNAGFPVESIKPHGTDRVIDVEVTSNSGDCLSYAGIARELAAILNLPATNHPIPRPTESTDPASAAVRVRIDCA